MDISNKSASLQEKALIQVAINKCQSSDFKEVVLCLEKPVYGTFISNNANSVFISDPEKLAKWAKLEKQKSENSWSLMYTTDEERLMQWEQLLEEQFQKLTEEVPAALKCKLQGWLNRMALDYLSFCRRQEALFGLSRYFMMEFVTREDWSESGRLDEERMAKRLVKDDERLTVLQRYRIACVYCLGVDKQYGLVFTLWRMLTQEEKASLSGEDNPNDSSEKNRLVLLWSYLFDRNRDEKVVGRAGYSFYYAIEQAVADGNRVALMPCWRLVKARNCHADMLEFAQNMAGHAFYSWLSCQPDRGFHKHCNKEWRKNLVLFESTSNEFSYKQQFNLPYYYSDLMCFILSEMSEDDQLVFIKKALKDKQANYILECFIDWPHQNYFLSTIRKLWGILSKYNYGRCLLILVSKYCGVYDWKFPQSALYTKEDRYYDYQTLLFKLWEETPEDYKYYLFTDKRLSRSRRQYLFVHKRKVLLNRFVKKIPPIDYKKNVLNEGRILLLRLISKYPLTEKVKKLFKNFLNYLSKEDRIAFMRSENGADLCSTLAQRQEWLFLDSVLREFLPEKEISGFKKRFIQSQRGIEICLYQLKEDKTEVLENFINWSFNLDGERKQFKEQLFYSGHRLCKLILRPDKFSEIERVMNYCSDSGETKEKFKIYLTRFSSTFLIQNLEFETLDRILVWCFDTKEKIVNFKKSLLHKDNIKIYFDFVFKKQWENVKIFLDWCNLSIDEINKLKKDTVFSERCFRNMIEILYDEEVLLSYLPFFRWCLIDEKMIGDFKKKFETILSNVPDEKYTNAKERLNYLIKELLSSLEKNEQNKQISEGFDEEQATASKKCKSEKQSRNQTTPLTERRGEKRSYEVIEESSDSPRKPTGKYANKEL